jgi:hypothetical protein
MLALVLRQHRYRYRVPASRPDPADGRHRVAATHAVRRIPILDGATPAGIVAIGDLAIERDDGSALADVSAAPPNI